MRRINIVAMLVMVATALVAQAAHAGRTAFQGKIYYQAVESVFDPKGVADAISLAKSGDADARMSIHLAIIGYMKIGQAIPEPLQQYLVELFVQNCGQSISQIHQYFQVFL